MAARDESAVLQNNAAGGLDFCFCHVPIDAATRRRGPAHACRSEASYDIYFEWLCDAVSSSVVTEEFAAIIVKSVFQHARLPPRQQPT